MRFTPLIPVVALAVLFLPQAVSADTIVTDQFSGFIIGQSGLALHTAVVGEFTYNPAVVGPNGRVGLTGVTSFGLLLDESSFAFPAPVVVTKGLSDLTAISINPNDPNQLELTVSYQPGSSFYANFTIGPNPGQFLFPVPPEDAGLPLGFLGLDGYGAIHQTLTPAIAPEPAIWGTMAFGLFAIWRVGLLFRWTASKEPSSL